MVNISIIDIIRFSVIFNKNKTEKITHNGREKFFSLL